MSSKVFRYCVSALTVVVTILAGILTLSGAAAPPRPILFFEEHWQQIPGGGENPVSQDHVANPDLELRLYGPKVEQLAITGFEGNDGNPVHTWSGLCGAGCVFAFRHRDYYADLSGAARIMVQSKTSGFHKLRPFLKLADGTALVGDYEIGNPSDWLHTEFAVRDVHWMIFNTDMGVTRGVLLDEVNLSRVDEIGLVDLQPGADHGAGGWSDVAVVRVFANKVNR